MNILVYATRHAECPYLAEGDPIPSGPCNHVMVTGSKACKSLNIFPLAPLPPKIIIFEPANTAECAYRGAGGVPDILGLVNLLALTSSIYVSFKYA